MTSETVTVLRSRVGITFDNVMNALLKDIAMEQVSTRDANKVCSLANRYLRQAESIYQVRSVAGESKQKRLETLMQEFREEALDLLKEERRPRRAPARRGYL